MKRLFFVKDFLNILFPRNCILCKRGLHEFEQHLCLGCESSLPRTNYPLRSKENDLTGKVMGLTKVNSAVSFLRFTKDGKSQKLIHEIKYRKKQELAKHLGYLFGQDLLAANYSLPDVLVPVPLHPKKEKRRGFNQSAIFAHGLSLALKIPVVFALERVKATESQTKKSRLERLSNVDGVFSAAKSVNLKNIQVGLVDDVMTTGATLSACGNELLANQVNKVDFITIASGR